jgi:cytochrome c oxidase subunit 2
MGPFLYSLVFHRASKYDLSDGPPVEGNTTLEVIWTIVPIVLVLTLATVSYRTYQKMGIRGPMDVVHLPQPQLMPSAYAAPFDDTPQREIQGALETAPLEEIDVTAQQWAWIFHYPDPDVTSTELHLPVDRRVRLSLHSADVLHGFYVPAFRLKQDVVPNHTIDLELTPTRIGTYRLRDSLFSGTYFAANQANVIVESPQDYEHWLTQAAAQPPAPAYNLAASEYTQANDSHPVRGWRSIPPAPPPVVNYSR